MHRSLTRCCAAARLSPLVQKGRARPLARRAASTVVASAVQNGSAVTVHYSLSGPDGAVALTSRGSAPVSYIVGEGEPRVPGLHTAVLGLSAGAKARIKLTAANAFGERTEENVFRVPVAQAPGFTKGDKVNLGDGRKAVIADVTSKEVVVDANNPLAGMPVDIDIEVLEATPAEGFSRATFAMGCFWGPELLFQRMPGVLATSVGYCNGKDSIVNPAYEDVCSGSTGFAEAVQVAFDPSAVSYEMLIDAFWGKHDPTQVNRQGGDVGTQYRSGIYAHDDSQLAAATAAKAAAAGRFARPIASEVVKLTKYYYAEGYHQQYLSRGGRNGNAQSPAKSCTDPIRCYG